jgi:hypothetical protein
MTLDIVTTDPLYRLGRIAGLAAQAGVQIDSATQALALTHPARGLARIQSTIDGARIHPGARVGLADAIGDVLDGLSDLPDGPIPIAAQAGYWTGYYQQREATRQMWATDLRDAGVALYGHQWQTALGNAVGVPSRRIREYLQRGWAPGWVRAKTLALLHQRGREAADLAERLSQSADEAGIRAVPPPP